jgi:cytochrome c biogenesis protein ResB
LRGDRNGLTPAATLVTHLAILLLLLGAGLSGAFGWREEITLASGGAGDVGHGSGLSLRNEGFTIERYPDGRAAGYEAQVVVLAGGQEQGHGAVRVNEPLVLGPVGFHLVGYGGMEGSYSVTLLAVHDPGYGLVIVAGLLLLLGMTASFSFPHCWVRARIEPDGTLRLAGWADRQGYGFGREFVALAEEVERSVEVGGEDMA